jgi:hypothetical protein
MSLTSNLTSAFTRVATEAKALRTLMNGNAADNTALTTTAKSNLVAAINELNAAITSLSGSAAGINDASTATTTTWSSQKTSDQIAASKASILGGAGAAYDTLKELQDLLTSDETGNASAIAAINTALGNRVRADTAAQGLTTTQKANARTNIDTYGTTDVGDVTTNFVTTFEFGLT